MSEINYEQLVSELIKPLTTHPEDVVATIENLKDMLATEEEPVPDVLLTFEDYVHKLEK